MDKTRKKNIKRIISLICAVAVVAVLAAMPLIAKQKPQEEGPQASILSGSAQLDSINEALIGGGTLAEETAEVISVPSAVKLTSFLVANGDVVTAGTPIATVDRVTVMTAITQVQETLEYLSEQIEKAGSTDGEEKVTALAGGTVKLLYAEEGDAVRDVMLEHGALAVLSLDGLMAVDLETESDLAAGTAVTLTLESGTSVTGKVAVNLAGDMTVTVEDDDYKVGQTVQVTDAEGTAIGSGALYIYSPWNATAYAGTVEELKVSQGDKTDAGDTLMTLTDVGNSAAYGQLVRQRQAYEELMLELFQMYQTETVTASCDGVVSGVDENSLQLLSGSGQGYTLTLLSNAPAGETEEGYANYVAQIAMVAQNGWAIKVDPQPVEVTDYLDLSDVEADPAKMTQTVLHTQTQIPIYALENGAWTQLESTALKEGDTLLFAAAGQGRFVWCVLLPAQQDQRPATPDTPERPGQQPEQPGDQPSGGQTDKPSGGQTEQPGGSQPSFPSGGSGQQNSGGMPNWNGSGSFPQGGSGSYPQGGMTQPEQEPEYELYGMEMTQIAAVTPQGTMTLEITVDEQDVSALAVGMSAQLRIDALGGEKHEATISQIGNTGTSNGGSSKYTVELTLTRGDNMLAGMTATASVVLSTAEQVLTVPAAALVEEGTRTLIYTGYDEENELLLNPVEVTLGVSDGKLVEILDGLTVGQTYHYAYYDTLEISYTPDFGGMGMFGR